MYNPDIVLGNVMVSVSVNLNFRKYVHNAEKHLSMTDGLNIKSIVPKTVLSTLCVNHFQFANGAENHAKNISVDFVLENVRSPGTKERTSTTISETKQKITRKT